MSIRRNVFVIVAMGFLIAGCADSSAPNAKSVTSSAPASGSEAKIDAAINELPEADRALAKAQKFCAISVKGRLGSMGKPVKIELDGKPVFLCCEGCEDEARKDAAKTLAKVEELKTANPQ